MSKDPLNLFIDDERAKPGSFNVLARTPEDAIETLKIAKETGWELMTVGFDHDMGIEFDEAGHMEEVTARPVLLWMIENNFWPLQLFVHSYSPAGAKWLMDMANEHSPEDCWVERINAKDYPA